MPFDLPPALYIALSLLGAAVVLSWRVQETRSPVSIAKVIIPPLGMSTGLSMFAAPAMRVPLSWALLALALGATLFAWALIRSSKLTLVGGQVLMQRSRAFIWILLGLVAVRFALRAYIERKISTPQTGALFFLLGLGAVVRWRAGMLHEYLKLTRGVAEGPIAQANSASDAPAPSWHGAR